MGNSKSDQQGIAFSPIKKLRIRSLDLSSNFSSQSSLLSKASTKNGKRLSKSSDPSSDCDGENDDVYMSLRSFGDNDIISNNDIFCDKVIELI